MDENINVNKQKMTKPKFPTFRGKPLIEIPEFIPHINFLKGEFGKAFIKEYKGRVKTDYKGNTYLNILRYEDGIVKGSNPFAVVLANQILKEENLRTATQADLEKTLRIGWNLRETHEDTGLVLRSGEDDYFRNTPIAKDLGSQLKTRGIKFSPKNPIMIPLTGFDLINSYDDYGLTFRLREDAEIISSPQLAHKNNNKTFNETNDKGLPIFNKDGNRNLYTRDSGLSRLCLTGGFVLYSDSEKLDSSSNRGRVVAVSAKGTSPEKLKTDLMDKIYFEYQAQLKKLNTRKAEAEKAAIKIMDRKC